MLFFLHSIDVFILEFVNLSYHNFILDNLSLIVNNLQRKDLNDSLALLMRLFRRNRKVIYEEITNSDTSRMDFLIDYVVKELI